MKIKIWVTTNIYCLLLCWGEGGVAVGFLRASTFIIFSWRQRYIKKTLKYKNVPNSLQTLTTREISNRWMTNENAVVNNKSGLVFDFSFFPHRCCCSVLLEHRRLWCQRAHKVQRRLESWTMLNGRMRDRENRGRRWRRRKWRAVLRLWKKMCDAAEQQQQQPRRLGDTGGAADVPAGPRSCGGGHRVNTSVTQSVSQDDRSLLTSSGHIMIVAEDHR